MKYSNLKVFTSRTFDKEELGGILLRLFGSSFWPDEISYFPHARFLTCAIPASTLLVANSLLCYGSVPLEEGDVTYSST